MKLDDRGPLTEREPLAWSRFTTWAGFASRPSADPFHVQAFQERRLRALVRHAWLRVPYYRRLFQRAGLRPDDVRTLADLVQLPITSNQDLQQVPLEDRIAEGTRVERCLRSTTSGSNGRPMVVLRSRAERFLLQAFRLRAQVDAGLRPTDRRVLLRGNPDLKPRLHHRLGIFAQTEVVSSLDGPQILEELRALAPDVIRGQPQTLNRVVHVIEATGGPPIRPRLIFSGADMLRPGMRRRIEEVCGCPIVDSTGPTSLIFWRGSAASAASTTPATTA